MQSLKITLKFLSPLGSLLQSDTIFGHFAWELKYLKGEDGLKKLLDSFEKEPFIVFSDGFVKDTVCMPFLKPKGLKDAKEFILKKDKKTDYYSKMKELKKARFVKVEDWVFADRLNLFDLYDFIEDEETSKGAIFIRNSVNRLSNNVQEGLYSTKEVFYKKPIDIYVKFASDAITKEEIREAFESIGKFGFGKDKSTGKGRFVVETVEDNPKILQKKNSKHFISLSSGVYDADCEIFYGKTFTKFGKHGGDLIFGNPFKNPAVLYKGGSVFKVNKTKEIYGRALKISNYNGHYHNAYMIPLFVDVEE